MTVAQGRHLVPQADRAHLGLTSEDQRAIDRQLGRPARAVVGVAARCVCGTPLVTMTNPRLPDGEPFPTFYYLTHPQASRAIGRLESQGVMAQLNLELSQDPGLAAAYREAHSRYLAARLRLAQVDEIANVSAGGMPNRVKCLHALAAHALAEGPGVNPVGDWTLTAIASEWRPDLCTCQLVPDAGLAAGAAPDQEPSWVGENRG
ncbi:MAG: DUF501 domain-containing protein [Bifidobacteriaceae bacterium]|nr:DUF501 domain-containing protein [Bifidobacteriaceae bacterium]